MRGLPAGRSGAPTRARIRSSAAEEGTLSGLFGWRYLDASILCLIVAAIVALDLVWVSINERPPHWDYARHLGDSLVYYHLHIGWSDLLLPLQLYVVYPPLVYWVTFPFYAVFGVEQWVAVFSNVVFLSILVFATYGIGKMLWSRLVGVLAALFVVTTPLFVTMFREYMLDAPLSAMVALALYLLIRSDNFAGRRASLLLGVACGLGLLTKWTFPLSLGLPAAYAIVVATTHAIRGRSAERIVNMLGAGLLAFAVSGVWYLHNWAAFRAEAARGSTYAGEITGQPPVGSLSSALWYFWNLLNNQLYLIPFVFFVVGVVYVCRKDESASKNSHLVLSIVGTYIAYSLLWNKSFRYTMPLLPAVAVVATHWLTYLSAQARRRISGGLVAYCVLAFLVISFGTSHLPKEIRIPLPARPYTSLFEYMGAESPRVRGIVLFAQHGWFFVGKPRRENWHVDETFREIAAHGGNTTFTFQADTDSIWFNTWDVRYYAEKYGLVWVGVLEAADFMVVRSAREPSVPPEFAEVKRSPLPDGGTLWLFERGV